MSLILKKPAGSLQGATDTDLWYVPVVSGAGFNSDFVAFTTDTAFPALGANLLVGRLYVLIATAACWFVQSNAGTAATKAAGSIYLPPNVERLIDGAQGSKIHVLQDSAGGNASLWEVTG